METIFVRRGRSGLVGATAVDAEALDALAVGPVYRAAITRAQPRSLRQHNLLWGLAQFIADNTEDGLTKDGVVHILKIETGHFDVCRTEGGIWFRIPSSINFASLDQDAFNIWFERALGVVDRLWRDGLREAVKAHLDDMLSGQGGSGANNAAPAAA